MLRVPWKTVSLDSVFYNIDVDGHNRLVLYWLSPIGVCHVLMIRYSSCVIGRTTTKVMSCSPQCIRVGSTWAISLYTAVDRVSFFRVELYRSLCCLIAASLKTINILLLI